MNGEQTRQGFRKWLWVIAGCLLGASALPILYFIHAQRVNAAPPVPEKVEQQPGRVSCLGRIEPEDGVIHVAGAYVLGQPHPPVVETIEVKEGDQVRRGALLAIFAGRAQLAAELAQAKADTAVARRRLEQVKAGAKQPDVSAQQADIARIEADLQNDRAELQRYEALRRTDDVTASELDARRTAVQVTERALEQARDRLESLKEVRDSDVQVAEAQLQAAVTNEQRAQRDYDVSAVHAPVDGQILKVHAHAGEEVGSEGLVEMGRTDRMYVFAEVYETDVTRVRPGQRATISGDIIRSPLSGTVERVDQNVKVASVLPGDTAAFSDNRVVEARIRLDQGDAVAGLIDGKVTVVIQP